MSANHARIETVTESTQWDLVLTRTFDAPRELVFKAWTDPQQVQQWWGPHGFTNPRCQVDARPGGAIRIDMRGPNGMVYPMKAVFEEVTEPERLVFVTSALDDKGNSMFDVRNTVTLVDRRGKTELTLQARVVRTTAVAPQYLEGMEVGWSQSLERLEAYVRSLHERRGE
jgi:uncharacterized protein YndB with AHSA1/START domain